MDYPTPVTTTDYFLNALLEEMRAVRKLLEKPTVASSEDTRVKESVKKR